MEGEGFYSSDEEVAWGPVTLKEIKGDLKRPIIRLPERRHTSHFCLKTEDNKTSIKKYKNLKHNKMEPIVNENPKIVIQGDFIPEISAYLTASEVVNAKNENSLSDYHSAAENFQNSATTSYNVGPESSVYYSSSDIERSTVKNLDAGAFRNDVSHLNFVRNAMERPSDYLFKNEQQTLVESQIYTPNNSLTEYSETDISTNVIEISSDEDQNIATKGKEINNDGIDNISCCTDKDCSREEEICEVESYCEENENIDEENSVADDSPQQFSLPISIPDIDLHQFNDSSDCPLNDTIEKINALLSQAENMSIDESKNDETSTENSEEMTGSKENDAKIIIHDDIQITDSYKRTEECTTFITGGDDNHQTFNLISGSFLNKSECVSHINSTPVKYRSPTQRVTPNKSNIPILKKSPDAFRVPNVPVKSRSGQKISKPNLKDVVSPVRMYIKYSPKPVLQQNMHAVDTKFTKPHLSPRYPEPKNKENIGAFPPTVLYKPSKKQVLASEKGLCLPASLDKLVIKSSVIKHERKPFPLNLFKRNESLNPESELTQTSLSDSQFNESDQNMSVLHKNTALRK